MQSSQQNRFLCLFPHQDDEIGLVPLLKNKIKEGAQPYCVFLTAGDGNGHSPEQRNKESLKVLSTLGILPIHIFFMGSEVTIPDGNLVQNIPLALKVIQSRFPTTHFSQIYCSAYEGGHPDHDACRILGQQLARKWDLIDQTWEYSMYHGYKTKGRLFKVFDLIPNGMEEKAISLTMNDICELSYLCWQYPSQWKSWIGLFPFALRYWISQRMIRLQKINPNALTDRPHPGPLLYERMKRTSFEEFTKSWQYENIQ